MIQRTLEYQGKVYRKGDPIGIKGEKGTFKFLWWETTKTNKEVVTVWWENRGARYFYLDKVKGINVKAEVLCPDHKKYKAIRVPKVDCARCWAAYDERHQDDDEKPKSKKPLKIEESELDEI